MASEGDVVFSREQDEKDSDIWDDSALIQAYDKAVHAMKIALDNDEEIDVDDLKEEEGGSITTSTETDEKTEETDDKTEDRDNKAERNNENKSF